MVQAFSNPVRASKGQRKSREGLYGSTSVHLHSPAFRPGRWHGDNRDMAVLVADFCKLFFSPTLGRPDRRGRKTLHSDAPAFLNGQCRSETARPLWWRLLGRHLLRTRIGCKDVICRLLGLAGGFEDCAFLVLQCFEPPFDISRALIDRRHQTKTGIDHA